MPPLGDVGTNPAPAVPHDGASASGEGSLSTSAPFGFSISLLRMFLLKRATASLTVDEVVQQLIRPATAMHTEPYLSAYIGILSDTGTPLVAPATVRVSYARECRFADVADVLQQWHRRSPESYFHMDIFCINQHNSSTTNGASLAQLRAEMRTFSQVLVVVSPWSAPAPWTRTWCLWEVLAAMELGVDVALLLPRAQYAAMGLALATGAGPTCSVFPMDALERSQTSLPADKMLLIADIIFAHNSPEAAMEQLRLLLETWFEGVMQSLHDDIARRRDEHPGRIIRLLSNISTSLQTMAHPHAAAIFQQDAAERSVQHFGRRHADTARALHALALVLDASQQHDRAVRAFQDACEAATPALDTQHYYRQWAAAAEQRAQLSHAMQACEHVWRISAAALGPAHPDTLADRTRLAAACQRNGELHTALDHYTAVAAAHQDAGHADLSHTHIQLGHICTALGRHRDAVDWFEKALAAVQEQQVDEHPLAADICSGLGLACMGCGDHDAAIVHLHRAINIRTATLGSGSPATAASWHHLATAFTHQHAYAQALECLLRAVALRTAASTGPDAAIASLHHAAGAVHARLGHHDAALRSHRCALDICIATLGEQHDDTAQSHATVAAALLAVGDAAQALEHHQAALAARAAMHGSHSSTAASHVGVGMAFQLLGQLDAARESFECALRMRQSVLGDTHSDTGTAHACLAAVLVEVGCFADALPHIESAVAAHAVAVGTPALATLHERHGWCLLVLERFEPALAAFSQALRIRESVLSPGDPHIGTSHHHIGLALRGMRQFGPSAKHLHKALAIRSAANGTPHDLVAESTGALACVLSCMGQGEKALSMLDDASAAVTAARGRLAELQVARGFALDQLGRHEQAIAALDQAVATAITERGAEDMVTAEATWQLACILLQHGQASRASPLLRAALPPLARALGSDHPKVRAVSRALTQPTV